MLVPGWATGPVAPSNCLAPNASSGRRFGAKSLDECLCVYEAHITARPNKELLYRTSRLRKDSVGVGANQSDGADSNDENHSQHHGVFSDVLTVFVRPELGH